MPIDPQLSHRSRARLEVCRLEERLAPAVLPTGYTEVTVASGIANATSMEFSPEGKLFVTQQTGEIQVWQNGVLQNANFFTGDPLVCDVIAERGLQSIEFDPDFATNRYVYVYYPTPSPVVHNRVSRFTADAAGTQVVPGSELVILELPSPATYLHHGGALHFGPDGKLYVAVGDNFGQWNAQAIDNPFGKILRLNSDGSIPTDNPFYNSTFGINRGIWVLGLRNPFTFAFQPGTGQMLINDVGEGAWEEINVGVMGKNYGWPYTEGDFNQADFPDLTRPLYAYSHSVGLAITGGVFYNPASPQFPPDVVGDYFYADYLGTFIKRLDLQSAPPPSLDYATDAGQPVDLEIDADGALYYVAWGTGIVSRITVDPAYRPGITDQPDDLSVPAGMPATFSVTAGGPGTLAYQWQRDGVDIAGANGSSYTLPATTSADDGAVFRVIVSNAYGQIASNGATIDVDSTFVSTVQVNSGSAQRSRVTELAVTFSSIVTFAGPVDSAFTLTRTGGGGVSFTATASVVNNVTVVTLNAFTGSETESGSLRDGDYTLTALASQISSNGQPMPADYQYQFFRFFGDVNGDRRIDISDFGQFSSAYNRSVGDPLFNADLDFNGDGRIDIADFGQFSVRFFTTLP